jgi:hypothetical protein
VDSGELETVLRDCLVRQANNRPRAGRRAADEVAADALRRAGAIRRRRASAGLLVVVLVVSLGAVMVVNMGRGLDVGRYDPRAAPDHESRGWRPPAMDQGGRPDTGQTSSSTTYLEKIPQERLASRGLPVDLVIAGRLLTVNGQAISLAAVGAVEKVYGIADGWLMVSSRPDGHSSLWQVTRQALLYQILSAVDRVVLAPDGRHLAWRTGRELRYGALAKGRLDTRHATPVPADAEPIGFVGSGVLLAGGDGDRLDVWWPYHGPYQPTWQSPVSGVYGALPDGRTLVAQVPGPSRSGPCLALLDATAGLVVRQRACDLPLGTPAGWLSPDGRWLVAEGALEASVLIDVANAFRAKLTVPGAGPGPYGAGSWVDRATLVYASASRSLVRVHTDRLASGKAGGLEEIPLDKSSGPGQVLVVPRLVG